MVGFAVEFMPAWPKSSLKHIVVVKPHDPWAMWRKEMTWNYLLRPQQWAMPPSANPMYDTINSERTHRMIVPSRLCLSMNEWMNDSSNTIYNWLFQLSLFFFCAKWRMILVRGLAHCPRTHGSEWSEPSAFETTTTQQRVDGCFFLF